MTTVARGVTDADNAVHRTTRSRRVADFAALQGLHDIVATATEVKIEDITHKAAALDALVRKHITAVCVVLAGFADFDGAIAAHIRLGS